MSSYSASLLAVHMFTSAVLDHSRMKDHHIMSTVGYMQPMYLYLPSSLVNTLVTHPRPFANPDLKQRGSPSDHMRLLNTTSLELQEFFDDHIPRYAILSHRWSSLAAEEVSYSDLLAQTKRDSHGFIKISSFCELAATHGFRYAWVDTCCIDKSSSAELSEAINSMYNWYRRATVCFVYLNDINFQWPSYGPKELWRSEWFQRGWTLQELLAPRQLRFFDSRWRPLGSRLELQHEITVATRIDVRLLAGETRIADYSVAQIMSWASRRRTSRLEDEAYCLLGLLGVNLPLLYGEGRRAFLRLQEALLALGVDNSLFAWEAEGTDTDDNDDKANRGDGGQVFINREDLSIFAPSPRSFEFCRDVERGFATQRILFEVTSHGVMVLIHRSYDREALDRILEFSKSGGRGNESSHRATTHTDVGSNRRATIRTDVGLTLPLGCFRRVPQSAESSVEVIESFFLQLVVENGKWHRLGVAKKEDPFSLVKYNGSHYFAYANDYVRLYMHQDRRRGREGVSQAHGVGGEDVDDETGVRRRRVRVRMADRMRWIHIRHRQDTSGSVG